MFEKPKPSICRAIFAVGESSHKFLLRTDEALMWVIDEIGCRMEDILDASEHGKLPQEIGVYLCEITLRSYKSNRYDDPEEWSTDITIDKIKLINSLEL